MDKTELIVVTAKEILLKAVDKQLLLIPSASGEKILAQKFQELVDSISKTVDSITSNSKD